MTDLDRKLQEIAKNNWQQFVEMVGEDAVTVAKICLLRREGKSYGQISVKLGITERQVGYNCGKCEPRP